MLKAQINALKKQGARLAAERNHLADEIEELHEIHSANVSQIVRLRKEIIALREDLARCNEFRSKLLAAYKRSKEKKNVEGKVS